MTFKNLIVPSLLALGVATSMSGCATSGNMPGKTVMSNASTKAELGSYGIALDLMDKNVKPGDNFFKYVNGGWLEKTEIPADKSNYGSFTALADRSEKQVRAIIQDLAKMETAPGSTEQKIGDLYSAFMDTETIEAKGMAPIQGDIDRIKAIKSYSDVASVMGDPTLSVRAPFGGWVDVDVKDTENYIFYVTQSGLGMGTRDYYLDDDEKSVKLRADYVTYLQGILTLAGEDNVSNRANRIMAFETEMAKSHWKPEKRRNRDLTYNKMTKAELKSYARGFDWDAMLKSSGLEKQDVFVIRENDAIKSLAQTFQITYLGTLKDYLMVHHIGSMLPIFLNPSMTPGLLFMAKPCGALKNSGTVGNAVSAKLAAPLVKQSEKSM